MTRREIIVELLRLLPEAIGGGGGQIGNWIGSGPDSKVLTFGPLWHADCPHNPDKTPCEGGPRCRSPFPELTRCLTLLKQHRPVQYQHLHARFYGGTTSRRRVRFQQRGRTIIPPRFEHAEIRVQGGATDSKLLLDCTVYTWPKWVRQRKVDSAIDYLTDEFQGSPFLPVVVLAA